MKLHGAKTGRIPSDRASTPTGKVECSACGVTTRAKYGDPGPWFCWKCRAEEDEAQQWHEQDDGVDLNG